MRAAIDYPGLVYMRGLRGDITTLFESPTKFEIGRARVLRQDGGIGIISTGFATHWAIEASDVLEERGTAHSMLHVPTLKPAPTQGAKHFRDRLAPVRKRVCRDGCSHNAGSAHCQD